MTTSTRTQSKASRQDQKVRQSQARLAQKSFTQFVIAHNAKKEI